MINQLAKLVTDGQLDGVNLKVTVKDGQPVVQLTSLIAPASHKVIIDDKPANEARDAVVAIRQALNTPVIIRGEDAEQSLLEIIPQLSGSVEKAVTTLSGLDVAAKLDSATDKGNAAKEKASASKKSDSKKSTSSATKKTDEKKSEASKAESPKSDDSATSDKSEPEKKQGENTNPVNDTFNFDAL